MSESFSTSLKGTSESSVSYEWTRLRISFASFEAEPISIQYIFLCSVNIQYTYVHVSLAWSLWILLNVLFGRLFRTVAKIYKKSYYNSGPNGIGRSLIGYAYTNITLNSWVKYHRVAVNVVFRSLSKVGLPDNINGKIYDLTKSSMSLI